MLTSSSPSYIHLLSACLRGDFAYVLPDRVSANWCCCCVVVAYLLTFSQLLAKWGLWLIVRCILYILDIVVLSWHLYLSLHAFTIYCRISWQQNTKIAILKILKIVKFSDEVFQNGWATWAGFWNGNCPQPGYMWVGTLLTVTSHWQAGRWDSATQIGHSIVTFFILLLYACLPQPLWSYGLSIDIIIIATWWHDWEFICSLMVNPIIRQPCFDHPQCHESLLDISAQHKATVVFPENFGAYKSDNDRCTRGQDKC